MTEDAGIVAAATSLAATVADITLPLDLPSSADAREVRTRLVDQFHDHLLPRLHDRGAPLLIVVGGSTGAGKSTLVNTIIGEPVSRTGVLRPTTRSSVLVHHPADREAFTSDRILPSLARASVDRIQPRQEEDPGVLTLVESTALAPGVALLDTPDIDSVAQSNRDLSRQLLAAADLWLFLTTPARYADAVPWDLLRMAAQRGTEIAVVLDRVEPAAMGEVRVHLRSMLDEAGLQRASLLVVPAVADVGSSTAMLPPSAVATVSDYLRSLAGSAQARQAVADATLRGALDSVRGRVHVVHAAVSDQLAAITDLQGRVTSAHDHAVATLVDAIDDGRVLRGEVLARWHDFVGAGDLLRWLETGIGRIRDRVSALWRPRARNEAPLTAAVGDGVVAVIVDSLQRARQDTIRAWRAGAGEQLLADLDTAAPMTTRTSARKVVQGWQDEVVELVRTQAGDKRATARIMALGLNGAAAALMVVVFASTAGLTGAEVGVAAGTSVVAQRLLEALLGDQAVRDLTQQARDALVRRVEALVAEQAQEFQDRLDALAVDPTWPRRLLDGTENLQVTRRQAEL